MTRIEKVIREIDELRDFYKKTQFLRNRIKENRQSSSKTDEKPDESGSRRDLSEK